MEKQREFFVVRIKIDKFNRREFKKFFMHTYLDTKVEIGDWAQFNKIKNYSIESVDHYKKVIFLCEPMVSLKDLLGFPDNKKRTRQQMDHHIEKTGIDLKTLENPAMLVQKRIIDQDGKYFIIAHTQDKETLYFYVEEKSYTRAMQKVRAFLAEKNKPLDSSEFVKINYCLYP